jgi:hypothetical protein
MNKPGAIQVHQELNPKIWADADHIDPQVREKLLVIAGRFYQFLKVPTQVKDIIVTGSQAGYTYTDLSDLDLHIIVSYANVECDQPVEELFDTKRKLWKENHTISIRGIPVECYAEDLDRPVKGSSYSLVKDSWITKPQQVEATDQDVSPQVAAWVTVITAAIRTRDIAQLDRVKSLLKTYRQAGLNAQGEMGSANMTFKTLRNLGVIAMLMTAHRELEDRSLSLAN